MVTPACGISMPSSYAKLFIATQAHLGGNKITNRMKESIFAQRPDGISIFDINKTWEKFVLAARAICGISYPETICAVSGKTFGRKAILKFSESIGCKPITSRFIPGSFTNTSVRGSIEPRLIIVSDPVFDRQAVNEASLVNCPVIAFCNTDASLDNVDIAIPINNRSPKAIGFSFFVLSKLVNYMRNGEDLEHNIKNVELFFYRDAVELERLMEENLAESKIEFTAPSVADDRDFGRNIPVETEDSGKEW
jgi:small subunit ribosomal protein SAe